MNLYNLSPSTIKDVNYSRQVVLLEVFLEDFHHFDVGGHSEIK